MSKNSPRRLTNDERAALAGQVKQVRQGLGMTQQELAAAAGVSRQTLSDLEHGVRVPQDAKLRAILDVLGIDTGNSSLSDDTRVWVGIIGGALEALPAANRARAGQAAVNAITQELVATSSNVTSLSARRHNVGGPADTDLETVELDTTLLAASTDDTPIDPSRGEG
jgi:transcriptional regulator with XRE-family HTH domain